MAIQFLSSNDIAERTNVNIRTVLIWAAKNDISYVGNGRRKIYVFTEEDYQRFLARPKPGKRAKKYPEK